MNLPTGRMGVSTWLATGLGVGLIPWAPGTFGTLVGLPLAGGLGHLDIPWQCLAIAVLFAAGVPICTSAARQLGRGHDPGCIVLDEIVAVGVTFLGVPMDRWWVFVLGFGLFRLFDISKPPPARQLERLPDGLGVMVDDIAAGIYSNIALRLIVWLVA